MLWILLWFYAESLSNLAFLKMIVNDPSADNLMRSFFDFVESKELSSIWLIKSFSVIWECFLSNSGKQNKEFLSYVCSRKIYQGLISYL